MFSKLATNLTVMGKLQLMSWGVERSFKDR